MVNLVQMKLPSIEAKLFEPGYGNWESSESYHTAQWVNGTGSSLEAGPITIYKSGRFVGEGFLSRTEPGSTAQVTFAVENRLTLKQRDRFEESSGKIVRIANERIYTEADSKHVLVYEATNNANEALNIMVKIGKRTGWSLDPKPEGSVEASDAFFVPERVEAKGNKEFTVVEKQRLLRDYQFMSQAAYDAVKSVLSTQHGMEGEIVSQLSRYMSQYEQLLVLRDKVKVLDTRKSELEADESQIARSLRDIKDIKTASASTLKEQLIRRQQTNERELAGLATEKAELRTEESSILLELNALIRSMKYESTVVNP